MVRIPTDGKETTVTIDFNYGTDPLSLVKEAQFYLLDLSALEEASNLAKTKAVTDYTLKDGYGRFTVENAKAGESLFVSVPVEKGWTITRNGEKISCDIIGNALMSIPLENGQNTIEISYKVPFKDTGILVSALGLLLLFSVIAIETVNKNKSSKTHPACKKHN